jgi:hypothetical protein
VGGFSRKMNFKFFIPSQKRKNKSWLHKSEREGERKRGKTIKDEYAE